MAGKSERKDVLINLVKIPMIMTGLWTRPLYNNPVLNKMVYAYTIFAKLNWFLFYFGLAGEFIRLVVQGYPGQIILASFTVFANGTKIAAKTIIYLKKNVLELCEDVIDRENDIWRENDPRIIKLYLSKYQIGKLFGILLYTSTIMTVIGLNAAGAYGNNQLIKYNEANNASLESHYNYQFYFPNKLEHLTWVYILGFSFSYGAAMYNITTHMILITLLMYTAAHMSLLQHRLKHYIPEDFKADQMEEAIKALKGFILEHRYLINFAEQINERCKMIIMLEYMLSSCDIATVTINIINLETSEVAWLIFMAILLVIQIFCLAYSCNEINVESQNIADAAFASRWHLLNKDGRQLTHLMIQRAQQRPCMMTIGPFGPMTTASFLTVMKAAYSYFSIML